MDLSAWTHRQLQQWCRNQHLNAGGGSSELRERIRGALSVGTLLSVYYRAHNRWFTGRVAQQLQEDKLCVLYSGKYEAVICLAETVVAVYGVTTEDGAVPPELLGSQYSPAGVHAAALVHAMPMGTTCGAHQVAAVAAATAPPLTSPAEQVMTQSSASFRQGAPPQQPAYPLAASASGSVRQANLGQQPHPGTSELVYSHATASKGPAVPMPPHTFPMPPSPSASKQHAAVPPPQAWPVPQPACRQASGIVRQASVAQQQLMPNPAPSVGQTMLPPPQPEAPPSKQPMPSTEPTPGVGQAGAQQQVTTSPAQEQCSLASAERFQAEGDRLQGSKQFLKASIKYRLAVTELTSLTSPAAHQLRTSCQAGLASCYLHLQRWQQCVDCCSEMLMADASNRRALYMRGQALCALGCYDTAVRDVCQAAGLPLGSVADVSAQQPADAQQWQLQAHQDVAAAPVPVPHTPGAEDGLSGMLQHSQEELVQELKGHCREEAVQAR